MSSDKPNFLAQPVVKNIFMFRNGDPYYEARRIVINQKRVCNFETLLREVTGGIQAPFGAVRNIYTPRGGHKVESLEGIQTGEQYVAAGRERFKRMDYFQIGSRKKRMMQTLPFQAKPLPQHRINVSARFLKPIKEPCPIFVVANGDVLNPAMRLLIHQRMLGQFDRILEMITEKMGLRVLGGVRSLFTYEGQQVTDGNQLESGQLYVAAGRERFKKLQYNDLLFTKPRGARRVNGMKAYSLPPIYRFSKQNGNQSKSMVRCSESQDGDSKASPPSNGSKEHLSSIVREISQARLISLRKKRSGQSMTLGPADTHDDLDGNTGDKSPAEQSAAEKPPSADAEASEENGGEKAEEREEPAEKEEEASAGKDDRKESGEEEKEESPAADEKDGEAVGEKEEEEVKEEELKEEEVKEEVVKEEEVEEEAKEDKKEEEPQSSSSKEIQNEKEERNPPSEAEKKDKSAAAEEEKEAEGAKTPESDGKDPANDGDTGEDQTHKEKSHDPDKTGPHNETNKSDGNSNQEESARKGGRGEEEEAEEEEEEEEGGQVSADDNSDDDDDEEEEESQDETEEKDSAKDATTKEKQEAKREETEKKKS